MLSVGISTLKLGIVTLIGCVNGLECGYDIYLALT